MLARPRQVTMAVWTVIAASILIVITVAQQFQSLGSVAMGDAIQRVLDESFFDSVSLSVDDVERTLRIMGMVSAGCATAAAILGWQVLAKRSTSARLALTILAVPLFFAGFSTGAVLSTAVAVAAGFLWAPQAQSWFAGTWKPEPPREAAAPAQPTRRIGQSSAPTGEAPRPDAGSSVPPPMAAWPPPAYDATATPATSATSAAPAGSAGAPTSRPQAVLTAVIVTWVFSALAAVFFVVAAAALVSNPTELMDRMREVNPELMASEGVTEDLVRGVFVFMAGVVVLWSLSACVLAFFVLRRAGWARIVLMVCAGCAALVLILASLASPIMVVPLLGATATVGLLARRDVAAWLR